MAPSRLDQMRAERYGGSATSSTGTGTRSTQYDPEIGKSIRELEKIQGRQYLKLQTGVLDSEEAVLKAQVDLAKALLQHEQGLRNIDRTDVGNYNDNVTKIQTALIAARSKLAGETALWNTRAVDVANREASAAATRNEDGASAAWRSISDGLLGDTSTTVLDPQLPNTLLKLQKEYPYGVQFGNEFTTPTTDAGWGSIKDTKTRDAIAGLLDRARNVELGREHAEIEFGKAKKSLGAILKRSSDEWGADDASRDAHYAEVEAQYKRLYESIDTVDPFETAQAKLANKEDEHYAVKTRGGRLDTLYEAYLGESGSATDEEHMKIGQAIFIMEQSGWREDNRPRDSFGQVFDDDGDGIVDRYISTPDDIAALLEWGRQNKRGAGRYGLKGGSTKALVRFDVKATPEQLAYLRDENDQYAYIVGEDGKRVYLEPHKAKALSIAPVQARAAALTFTTGGKLDGLKFPDGSYRVFHSDSGEWRDVSEYVASAEDTGWISSEQTAALLSENPPPLADLKPSASPEAAKSSVQYTRQPPPQVITREGEKMKIHATDMIKQPAGSIRLRGGETIPADQIVGPVQVFASLTRDFGLTGDQGSYAKWKGLEAQGKVKGFVAGGALERRPVGSRIINNIQFDTFGVDGEKRIRDIFGEKPPELSAEEEYLGLDKGAPPSDRQQKRTRHSEAMRKWRAEGSDPANKPSREFTRDELLRGTVRGELPGEEFERDKLLEAWEEEGGRIPERPIPTLQIAPTDAAVTEADLAIKEQQVPERTMASLAQEQRDWKAYQEGELETPLEYVYAGEASELDSAAKQDARKRARETAKRGEDAYNVALDKWEAAGAKPDTKPVRPVSFIEGSASSAPAEVSEEEFYEPFNKHYISKNEGRRALTKVNARPKLPLDFTMEKEEENVSPEVQALRDFGKQLQEGDLEWRMSKKKKKKKDAESPTEAVALGAESVPGAGGVDQGSEISKEEEE